MCVRGGGDEARGCGAVCGAGMRRTAMYWDWKAVIWLRLVAPALSMETRYGQLSSSLMLCVCEPVGTPGTTVP